MADSPPNERVAELGPVTGAPVVRAATLAPLGTYVVPPGREIKLEMVAAAAKPLKKNGGAGRDRTDDLYNAIVMVVCLLVLPQVFLRWKSTLNRGAIWLTLAFPL